MDVLRYWILNLNVEFSIMIIENMASGQVKVSKFEMWSYEEIW